MDPEDQISQDSTSTEKKTEQPICENICDLIEPDEKDAIAKIRERVTELALTGLIPTSTAEPILNPYGQKPEGVDDELAEVMMFFYNRGLVNGYTIGVADLGQQVGMRINAKEVRKKDGT